MSKQLESLSPENKEALIELLFQLADDDFLYAYRGSEWLGLAPHIEEDVAYSSINQDSMGHSAMFYNLVADLVGEGRADDLAHGRPANERKNCILVERVNGPGHYMVGPEYDWAYAVVRNYLYTTAKKIKMDSLKQSTYGPLAEIAVKVNMEIYYHLLHWKTWFVQLLTSTEDAREKMVNAVERVMNDFGDVFSQGAAADNINQFGLIETEQALKARFDSQVKSVFDSVNIKFDRPEACSRNGRNGEHTEELVDAIETLATVYNLEPVAPW